MGNIVGDIIIGATANPSKFKAFVKQVRTTLGIGIQELTSDRELRLYHDGTQGVIDTGFISGGAANPLHLRANAVTGLAIQTTGAVDVPELAAPAVSGATASRFYQDSTSKRLKVSETGRVYQFAVNPMLYSLITSSAAIANTTVETAFDKTFSIPAGVLDVVGTIVEIKAYGVYSTAAAGPNLFVRARIGGVNLAAATTIAAPASASALGWEVDASFVVRAPGTTGTIFRGTHTHARATTTGGQQIVGVLGNTATLDTTIARIVDVVATWGTADAANTITMTMLTVRVIYPGTAT